VGAGNISLHHHVQNGSGAHPASYPLVPGAVSLWVKWPGHEADLSPPSSAMVKEWVVLYLHSQLCLHGIGAQLKKKQKDNFTFTMRFVAKELHWMWFLFGFSHFIFHLLNHVFSLFTAT